MDQFADDDDDATGERKGRFMNSKNTGNLNKFKRDKNTPATKSDDKPTGEAKVFKPTGKVTLGTKWDTDEDADKKLAAEKLKLLEETAQPEQPKAPVKKEPKFTGKANISDKTRQYDEEEKERQRLAQEKLASMSNEQAKGDVKIALVKDEPKVSKFTNSKKDVDNKFKKPKAEGNANVKVSSSKGSGDDKKEKVVAAPAQTGPVTTVTANKW